MKYIEDELRGYTQLKKRITEVRLEIEYPFQDEPDENIGGGRSNQTTSPTEVKATRLAMDKRLEHLQKVEDAIESTLNELDDRGKEFVTLMYLKRPQKYTMEGIAQKIHVSTRTAYNIRKLVIKRVAEKLGM